MKQLEVTDVLFDLDGTLMDSEPFHVDALKQMLAEMGVSLSPEEFEEQIGINTHDFLNELSCQRNLGFDEDDIQHWINRKREIFSEIIEVRPFPGAVEFVKSIATNYRLSVVSASRLAYVEWAIEKMGIRPLISAIVSGDCVERRKPDPAPFLEACRRLEVDPRFSAVIEDSVHGITSARAACAWAIALTHSIPEDRFKAAHYVFSGYDELIRSGLFKLKSAI
jgi:beta-phosphoglucomutase-like phosphatase (HAD superfamily)